MINVVEELKDDVNNEFQHWHETAARIRLRCWLWAQRNFFIKTSEQLQTKWWEWSIHLLLLEDSSDTILGWHYFLAEKQKERNHVDVFTHLPFKTFSASRKYESEMTDNGNHFPSETKRKYYFWKNKTGHSKIHQMVSLTLWNFLALTFDFFSI